MVIMAILPNYKPVDNFTIHPDPIDLQNNQTFLSLAQAEFAQDRSGMLIIKFMTMYHENSWCLLILKVLVGPLVIASGNAASFLPFPVIAPERYEDIVARLEAQDPGAFLPPGSHPTIIAGYAAQKASLAKTLRSYGSATFNLFLLGNQQDGGAHVLLHPLSRGTINIVPSDPYFTEPVIDYRALTNPTDLDILTEFVRFTRRCMFSPLAVFLPGPLSRKAAYNALRNECRDIYVAPRVSRIIRLIQR